VREAPALRFLRSPLRCTAEAFSYDAPPDIRRSTTDSCPPTTLWNVISPPTKVRIRCVVAEGQKPLRLEGRQISRHAITRRFCILPQEVDSAPTLISQDGLRRTSCAISHLVQEHRFIGDRSQPSSDHRRQPFSATAKPTPRLPAARLHRRTAATVCEKSSPTRKSRSPQHIAM
jgi:hypothetical protein